MINVPEKKNSSLRVVFMGDVVGRPGRTAVSKLVRPLRARWSVDLVVANGENAAGGAGIDAGTALELRSSGVDLITLGDHAFQRKGVAEFLSNNSSWCIRPHNLPEDSSPGKGWCEWQSPDGLRVRVLNVIGRVFMGGIAECPFRDVDRVISAWPLEDSSISLCDFHAEATSEKWAMARHTDGRLSLLVGTHTHVQTSDAQVLPLGTGYITDLGMTGSPTGVIGMDSSVALRRFLAPTPAPYEVAVGEGIVCGVVADIDKSSGKTEWIASFREG